MTATERIRRRLQISGVLIIAGLAVEAICLLWSRPIAFVVFAALGGLLIATGVLCFLYSLVSPESGPATAGQRESKP